MAQREATRVEREERRARTERVQGTAGNSRTACIRVDETRRQLAREKKERFDTPKSFV